MSLIFKRLCLVLARNLTIDNLTIYKLFCVVELCLLKKVIFARCHIKFMKLTIIVLPKGCQPQFIINPLRSCWKKISHPQGLNVGGAVASWLVRWTPDRTVRVRALAGALRCVLGQDTLLPECLSPPRCINGYRRIYYWG